MNRPFDPVASEHNVVVAQTRLLNIMNRPFDPVASDDFVSSHLVRYRLVKKPLCSSSRTS